MAQKALINVKKVGKDLNRISKTIAKMEDIATTRALNILLLREEKAIAADVSKEYGITQKAARDKSKPKKASKISKNISLTFRSLRMNIYKAKQLKSGGLSFQPKGGGRVKVTTKIGGGSKPFMVNAKAGGQTGGDNIKVAGGNKKVPVYMKMFGAKMKTMRGSSIAHMVGNLEINEKRLLKRIKMEFPKEYRKQLKGSRHTGRF